MALKKMLGIFIILLFISNVQAQEVTYSSIGFSYNAMLKDAPMMVNGDTFPTGSITFSGIPFIIPAEGNNFWNSYYISTPNPRCLDITVDKYGVTEIHTLINTFWGQSGTESYAFIEFFGSNGAYLKFDLIGNDHMRDFLDGEWTNMINGITTLEVFNNGQGQRLDKQVFRLPSEFLSQKLDKVRLTDNGVSPGESGNKLQRVFLAGITVGVSSCSVQDSDNDGVIDLWDNCPNTEAGSCTNKNGCVCENLYTKEQLDKAVADAVAAKDAVIAQKDQTISGLNSTIASMYTKERLDKAVADAVAAKDQTISGLNATIASMYTKEQLDKAAADAVAAKDTVIAQKDQTISGLNATITSMYTKEQLDKAVTDERQR